MSEQESAGGLRPSGEAAPKNGSVPAPEQPELLKGCSQPPPPAPPREPARASDPYAYAGRGTPPPPKLKPPFDTDGVDLLFAPLFFVLGYAFLRWGVWFLSGMGTATFTALYVALMLCYARNKGLQASRGSWFWMAVVLCCGFSSALWRNGSFAWVRLLFLLGAAVCWVMALTGCLISGRAGNFLPADLCNGFFHIPFANFDCQFQAAGRGAKSLRQGKSVLAVLLGLCLCVPVLGIVLPLLIEADKGFGVLVDQLFSRFFSGIAKGLLYALLGVPISCYLYGLAAGCIHKRQNVILPEEKLRSGAAQLRVLPAASVFTVLAVVCCTYLLFMLVQAEYLFSAFVGVRPSWAGSYSDYARQGFFELCKAAGFNAVLLFLCNTLCKRPRRDSPALRGFNLALTALTLLLIATAFSKMALYVDVYGLSHKRLLTCWFMIFLLGVFLSVLLLQFREFSIVRVASVLGSVMFTLLCLVNVDGVVAGYNLGRYERGGLPLPGDPRDFLSDCGPAAAPVAFEVYGRTRDERLKKNLEDYFSRMPGRGPGDGAEWYTARLEDLRASRLLRQKDMG